MQGKFITLEGGEGTGKSTQIKLLSEYLQGKGVEVITTKEPGGTPLGQEIRRLLVTGEQDKLDAVGEALLFFAVFAYGRLTTFVLASQLFLPRTKHQ